MTAQLSNPRAALHLVKLCVGADSVSDLADWQAARMTEAEAAGADPRPRHITRMWPRQAAALLQGGSLYWVIQGVITVRQRLLALDAVTGDDGIRRCALVLDPDLVRVDPRPRRPFQGWRYLPPAEAPPDLAPGGGDELPAALRAHLAELGLTGR